MVKGQAADPGGPTRRASPHLAQGLHGVGDVLQNLVGVNNVDAVIRKVDGVRRGHVIDERGEVRRDRARAASDGFRCGCP